MTPVAGSAAGVAGLQHCQLCLAGPLSRLERGELAGAQNPEGRRGLAHLRPQAPVAQSPAAE